MHESYKVLPHQFPKRSFKTEQIMFAGILKYLNSVYLSGSSVVWSAVMHDLQMSQLEKRAEKRQSSHKIYN